MLTLYDLDGTKVGMLKHASGLQIKRTLEYGDESMTFEYPKSGPYAGSITNEAYIRTERQEYVIKQVDASNNAENMKLAAALNIEGLEGKAYQDGFETIEKTIAECMAAALNSTGWAAVVSEKIAKKRRTIRKEEDVTAWELVKAAVTTYRAEVAIDSIGKKVYFYEHRGSDRGAYFYERLNLKKLGVSSSTYGFFTRLIPIGKDGLHLWEDEERGLENFQYSNKVVTAIWRDERYTNTTALREDAEAKLAEASAPVVSYSAEVRDLAAQSELYSILDYDLGDTVLLVSEQLGTMVRQRIVKIEEYPEDPEKNRVEISSVKQTFATLQKTEAETAKEETIAIAGRSTDKKLRDGYYTKTETDTAIRAMKAAIELEVAGTYLTKGEGEEYAKKAHNDAVQQGLDAQAAAQAYTDGELVNYYTKVETDSAVKIAKESITAEVAKTYATQETVKQAKTDAEAYTDEKLKDYSTTVETDTKIEAAAGEIYSMVASNYTQVETDIDAAKAYAGEQDEAWSRTVTANYRSEIEQTTTSWQLKFTALNSEIEEQGENLESYKEETAAFFRFSDEGLEIGKALNDSAMPYSVILNNEKMSFRQYGSEIAYVQYNKMHINAIEAMDKLSVGAENDGGYFDFISTQYGMGVKWRYVEQQTAAQAQAKARAKYHEYSSLADDCGGVFSVEFGGTTE